MNKKEIERLKNTGYREREGLDRRDYNRAILDKLRRIVEEYPDQRFGQIIVNYIFPNYQDKDIFFEESKETYKTVKTLCG